MTMMLYVHLLDMNRIYRELMWHLIERCVIPLPHFKCWPGARTSAFGIAPLLTTSCAPVRRLTSSPANVCRYPLRYQCRSTPLRHQLHRLVALSTMSPCAFCRESKRDRKDWAPSSTRLASFYTAKSVSAVSYIVFRYIASPCSSLLWFTNANIVW